MGKEKVLRFFLKWAFQENDFNDHSKANGGIIFLLKTAAEWPLYGGQHQSSEGMSSLPTSVSKGTGALWVVKKAAFLFGNEKYP